MSHDFMGMDEERGHLARNVIEFRPDPAATRITLESIVEEYFDDMGLHGEARRQAYADLAAKIAARDVNATQPKERKQNGTTK